MLDWQVFKPGFHKKQYYSAEDCRRAVENFAKYSVGDDAPIKVKAKLGHDDEQRLANSLGYPNQGWVKECRPTPDGGFALDIDGVPVATGGEINAGRLNDGSVELDWDVPDPFDPAKVIPGPVLTAIAFLGEEQPGVKGLPSPKATFSDNPGRPRTRRIRFSEVDPMNRDDLIAQLKAKGLDVGADPALANLPDEALAALLKAMPAAAPAAMTDPNPGAGQPDPNAALMAKFADLEKKFADSEKEKAEMSSKFNHLSAAFADATKDKDEVKQAAAFAADFKAQKVAQKRERAVAVVTKAVAEGRALPAAKDALIDDLCRVSDASKDCFADGPKKGKSPFEAACEDLLARPADRRFSAAPNPLPGGTDKMDAGRRAELLGHTGELGRNILRQEAGKK